MPARHKFWIITIVMLFIVSFLFAFKPVRRPVARGVVESTFRYEFAQPLVADAEDREAKAAEIEQLLEDAGVTTMTDGVVLLDNSTVDIETTAVTAEVVEQHKQVVTSVLQQKFAGVSGPQRPSADRQEQPIWQPFESLAIYSPRPQIKLGLDLQGGAHVVLRCLPQATMHFDAPEDKPLVKRKQKEAEEDAETAGTAESPPVYQPPETEASLVEKVRAVLVHSGLAAEEVEVEVPAPHLLVVRTRANDKDTAEKHQKIVADFLQGNYPGVEIEDRELETVFIETKTAEKVKNIVDRRLYQMGHIREPIIQQQGADQIIIELPGVKDPEHVMDILKSTAQLEFRVIPVRYTLSQTGEAADEYREWSDTATGNLVPWEQVYNEAELGFTGADLKSNARVVPGATLDFVVSFELRDPKKTTFYEFTRRHVDKRMAIVLDKECQMAPVIRSAISGGRGQIEGNFAAGEAGDLALLLNAGALPVPLEIAENRTVSATLGQDTIHRSLIAGGIAFGCVILFVIGFYRLPGILAGIALVLYVLLLLAVLVVAGATMTLPGVAGLILSIGFAVDANVIIFERLKEELWSGRTMRSAVEAGFDRAWTAILDANVTTLIVTAVLYFLGTSLIKSFAVVLFLGICASLFTAVTVTRWLVTITGRSSLGQNMALYGVSPRKD